MLLRDIFVKPIDRPIEGVIKADDESSLVSEFEEYVLTPEVARNLDAFIDAYNSYRGANGVWISGFFGSGKSHLLKILSYLLENRPIGSSTALEIFLPKCEDEMLKGAIGKAAAVPSKSVLFNIDQKADIISKTETDALLAVFMKVFDDMCGYCGKLGYVAQFERELDKEGVYEGFKAAYRGIAGLGWNEGRERPVFQAKNISKAYAQVAGISEEQAQGVLEKHRAQYKVSIEDFAELVREYIDRQGKHFRLNFFVDEVGQYIAGSVKLMTNLQTIAESLATRCQGRAWLVVTAQEDMNALVGEMNKQQANDFSKILARFANKLHLTSMNVEKVIQKRLLDKNQSGKEVLKGIYEAQRNNFRTLFDFADGGQTYHNYRDEVHFLDSYPFVPYQYPLFQLVIKNLSDHNAFEGKHSSVGERSMLGVFREVAINLADRKVGELAPFDFMFEGIRTVLKSGIQNAVQMAEQHLGDPFSVRVLKVLFMVKYVREFKPTIRNLCVLLRDRFDGNMADLQKEAERALNLLEQQNYIERNGDLYEFLTNEEKDVEEEIKNTDLDADLVFDALKEFVFDRVLGLAAKYRHSETGQDFPLLKKIDGKAFGNKGQELAVHVISPFHEKAGEDESLRMLSMVADELVMGMPNESRLIKDLQLYLQTEKYVTQKIGHVSNPTVDRILREKRSRNEERKKSLNKMLEELLGRVRLYVRGEEIETSSRDPKVRLAVGFEELVRKAYPNLRMLGNATFSENDLEIILDAASSLFNGEDLSEAEQEELSSVHRSQAQAARLTVKALVEQFEKRPYGWPYPAVLCILAHLCAKAKVECTRDAALLEGRELARALRNTSEQGKIILKTQAQFTPSQIAGLKHFHQEMFDEVPGNGDPRKLAQNTSARLKELAEELARYLVSQGEYPFLSVLQGLPERLKDLAGKNYADLFSKQPDFEDLLDKKEDLVTPIRQFMGGSQKEIYDQARNFLRKEQANLGYLEEDSKEKTLRLKGILESEDCFRGRGLQEAKGLFDSLKTDLVIQIASEKKNAELEIQAKWESLAKMQPWSLLGETEHQEIATDLEKEKQSILDQVLIGVLREKLSGFKSRGFTGIVEKVIRLAAEKTPPKPPRVGQPPKVTPPDEAKVISVKDIPTPFKGKLLSSEDEVREYVQELERTYLERVRANCSILVP